jgi:hypothetical protein
MMAFHHELRTELRQVRDEIRHAEAATVIVDQQRYTEHLNGLYRQERELVEILKREGVKL